MNLVREIKQYQAPDGTCFNTKEEAEQYAEMLKNPHFKKLQERIEKLESDLLALKADVASKTWTPSAIINRPPYQQPMYSYQAYNPATGRKEQ